MRFWRKAAAVLHAATSTLTFAGKSARATRAGIPVLGITPTFVSEFACFWIARKVQ